MNRFRIEARRVHRGPTVPYPPHRGRGRRFTIEILAGFGAIASLAVSQAFGNVHAHGLEQRIVALVGAGIFFTLAVVAVHGVSGTLASLISVTAGASGAAAVRVMVSFVGYVIVVFVGLGILDVPVQHLVLGGALTGVIVGIAAQQSLGNVFAGFVLLVARPFEVGQRVRVRAGSLGGTLDGRVRTVNLVYVTLDTDDGPVQIPNSTLLAAGVGPAPEEQPPDLAVALGGAPSVDRLEDPSGHKLSGPLLRPARAIDRLRSR